jgi:hypothetical protein
MNKKTTSIVALLDKADGAINEAFRIGINDPIIRQKLLDAQWELLDVIMLLEKQLDK